ncbi:MAG: chemotaxis protein CheX [Bacteriovoracaceae bacterium]|nr:chemotaxis protein CheX [Bacteriovoracaceae bacterium]
MTTSNFVNFSKPFVDAAKSVYETMVSTKLETEKPLLKKDTLSRGDVSAVIGINGTINQDGESIRFKGMLVLSWPYDTYFKIATSMLMEEFTEYNEEIADVGGEICNMIMGGAKRQLSDMGYATEMAIPSMIEGKGHTIKYPPGTTVMMIPLNSAHGKMFMELCFRAD